MSGKIPQNLSGTQRIPSFNNPFVKIDIAKPNNPDVTENPLGFTRHISEAVPLPKQSVTAHQHLLFRGPFYPTYKNYKICQLHGLSGVGEKK